VGHAPVEPQVVLRTEALIKAGVFEKRPGAGADLGALRSRIEAKHLSASAGWFDQAEQQPNGGCLAGAVGTEKTEYGSGGNLDAEIVKGANERETGRVLQALPF